jgi:transcriptional regulator with XRE-family HTH domain
MATHLMTSKPATGSFRQRLQEELAARCGRNPRYSLRAFANFLGIDHASLSQLMRGKRAMSEPTIRRLGSRIGLLADDIERYIATRETEPASNALAADVAAVLKQGPAFAILELMRLREFRPDVRWIARMLGVDGDDVNIALQHLLRLGVLQMESASQWRDLTNGALHHEEEFTQLALERLLARAQELQRASVANAPDAVRLHGSATLAVAAADVPRLMALAEALLNDARACGSASGDQLYHIEIHCLPLNKARS